MLKFLDRFRNKKSNPIAPDKLVELEERIRFLSIALADYRRRPMFYNNHVQGPVADAYNKMLLEKTQLEIELIVSEEIVKRG